MRYLFIYAFLFLNVLNAQIIFTEIMFDPAGPEKSDEFIEIYNSGNSTVDLSGWQIGDSNDLDEIIAVASGLLLLSQQYAVIFDSNYFSDSSFTYNQFIPEDALIIMIDGATFGNGGLSNSTPRSIFLVNAAGDTVQSYLYSADNESGRSDEKMALTIDNAPENWGNSRQINGTPGGKNTLTRGNIDLAVLHFRLLSQSFVSGIDIPFSFYIKNVGVNTLENFSWQTFYDTNLNGFADAEEILETGNETINLTTDDSTMIEGFFTDVPFGEIAAGVAVTLTGDEDTLNNMIIQSIYADDPGAIRLFINEIMANPATGSEEWIEIANWGNTDINLKNRHFADANDTIKIIETDFWIAPESYIVLGGDSLIASQYNIPLASLIINKRFPSLNNGFDDLRLLGPSFVTYDHVPYTSDWYDASVDRGVSLEKLNPLFEGQIGDNWTASAGENGSTPAARNSVFLDVLPAEDQLTITPNPFSPDQDGHEDFTAIQFEVNTEIAFLNVRIYDIRGRLIRHLSNGDRVAASGRLVWDGKDDTGRIARMGAYVCLFQALNAEKGIVRELKEAIILVKK